MGNIVTKYPIQKVALKSAGISTIGGKKMWFDWDINRLNEDGRGELLGDFKGKENIIAICKDGTFYTTNLDLFNKYQGDLMKVQKFDSEKVFTAIYWDNTVKSYYIKRFVFELSDNNVQFFIADTPGARLVDISEDLYPQVKVTFVQNGRKEKEAEFIDADEFIAVKGYKAKGKRAAAGEVATIEFVEPLEKDAPAFDAEDMMLDSEDINEENFTPGEDGSQPQSYRPGDSVDINIDGEELTLF